MWLLLCWLSFAFCFGCCFCFCFRLVLGRGRCGLTNASGFTVGGILFCFWWFETVWVFVLLLGLNLWLIFVVFAVCLSIVECIAFRLCLGFYWFWFGSWFELWIICGGFYVWLDLLGFDACCFVLRYLFCFVVVVYFDRLCKRGYALCLLGLLLLLCFGGLILFCRLFPGFLDLCFDLLWCLGWCLWLLCWMFVIFCLSSFYFYVCLIFCGWLGLIFDFVLLILILFFFGLVRCWFLFWFWWWRFRFWITCFVCGFV